MFRGRSDDKDNGSQRRGSGQPKGAKGKDRQSSAKANPRQSKRKAGPERGRTAPGERNRGERASDQRRDPRSTETGKKIRRIESGTARQADPTDLGGPPSRPPARRPVEETTESTPGVSVPGGLASRPGSLPPLQQPTGEIPRIPVEDVAPDQTVTIAASGADGVFAQARDDEGTPGRPLRAVPSVDISDAQPSYGQASFDKAVANKVMADAEPRSVGDELDNVQAELRAAEASSSARQDKQREIRDIPSALPDFDEVPTELPLEAARNGYESIDESMEIASGSTENSGNYAAVGAAAMTGEVGTAMAGRDPFESANQSPALTAAGQTRQAPPVDATRPMPQGLADGGGFSDPRSSGAAPTRRPDSGRPRDGGRRDRPQDTEFKLADNRPRKKPKEPNRFLLAVGLGAILLLGAAAAWYFTQGDDSTNVASGDSDAAATVESTDDATAVTDPATPEATAAPEPAVTEPTLFFDAAMTGPLQQGETYSIDLVGEPEGSLLQVVVDDIPQGNPDLLLPDLILPAGRHSLYIQMTNGAEVTQSTPIELYVVGDQPAQGFRVNLSSVDMQTEGWQEAIRQFDEYRAAGHEALQLLPISPGYWNLFIGGLGEERSAAQTYCESFSLAIPDQCFPTYYEPSADTTATTAADAGTESTDGATESTDAMTDEDPDAMTDEDATSTTVAGG